MGFCIELNCNSAGSLPQFKVISAVFTSTFRTNSTRHPKITLNKSAQKHYTNSQLSFKVSITMLLFHINCGA